MHFIHLSYFHENCIKVQNCLLLQTKISIALVIKWLLFRSVLQRWLWVTSLLRMCTYQWDKRREFTTRPVQYVFPSRSYITRQNQIFISHGKCWLKMSPLLQGSLIFYTFKAHCHVSVLPCICCGRIIVALSLPNLSIIWKTCQFPPLGLLVSFSAIKVVSLGLPVSFSAIKDASLNLIKPS